MNTNALLDWASACAVRLVYQHIFLTWGPLWADSCLLPRTLCLHTFAFTRFSLSLGPSFSPRGPSPPASPKAWSVPHVLESLSWNPPSPACASYMSFPCIPCNTDSDPCCSIHSGLSTFAHRRAAIHGVANSQTRLSDWSDAKFCKLLDSRDWVISIACKAQNLSYHSLLDGWVDG